jgi:hypothetical protein
VVGVTGGDFGWLAAHADLLELHIRKSATYGTDDDRLANFTETAYILRKPPEYPIASRMIEKLSRTVHMLDAGDADLVKEWPDLASLALCAESLRRRRIGA